MRFLIKYRIVILFSLCAALAYTHFFLNRAFVELNISTAVKTDYKVYWAGADQGYSEENMVRVAIGPETDEYTFYLTDLRQVRSLRIDPSEEVEEPVYLKEITIKQHGLPAIHLVGPEDFSRLKPMGGVYSTGFSLDGWRIEAKDNDPRFQLEVNLPARSMSWPAEIVRILLLITPFFLLAEALSFLWPDYLYTTYQGVFVLALILCMAAVTRIDHHPDERVHFAATRYYESNWLPPAVESPEIRDSYSDFGISRLNNMEVSYFFAGKFGKLLELFPLQQATSFRLFNATLFAVLVFLAFANVQFRLFFIPMLLSPQIWYIFSYMNSDAFSLFVVMLAGWQVASPDSAFNTFLDRKKIPLLKIFGLGLLLALLIFVKKNYYFFILFLLLFFGWRCLFQPFADFRNMLKRLLIICCIGFVFAGLRVGADLQVNGLDKKEKIAAMQELTAKPMFKPSTPLEEKFNYILLRDRGISYWDMLKVLRWGEKSFRSGFGAYGYMTVLGPDSYYNMIRLVGLAALLFMGGAIILRGGRPGILLFACGLLCSAALLAKASHYAWTVDFQGQGRYFFPIVPIIGMVLIRTEKVYNQLVLRTLSSSMFFLSAGSFIFIGLYGLAKYGTG